MIMTAAKIVLEKKSIFLLSLFVLLVNACALDESCIMPGEGYSQVTVETIVKASNPEWTDSTMEVASDETVPLNITGSVNLCVNEENSAQDVLVHSFYCEDGLNPQYPTSPPYDEVYHNPDLSTNLCPSGESDPNYEYTETGIAVKNGDFLIVELNPYIIKITDCDNLPYGVYMDEGYYDASADGSEQIAVTDVCKRGGTIYLGGQPIQVEPILNREYPILVSNLPSPEGNKFAFDYRTIPESKNQYWFHGSFLDLRLKEEENLENFNCSVVMSENDEVFEKTDALLLNEHCGYWCEKEEGSIDRKCFLSRRRPVEVVEMEIPEIGESIPIEVPIMDDDGYPLIYLEGLLLKVGGDKSYNDSGDMKIGDISYRKPIMIEVPEDDETRTVKFALRDSFTGGNIGGYNLQVKRVCPRSGGGNLYMYIGDDDPRTSGINPGDEGTFHIGNREAHDFTFVVNEDNDPRSGKIYFIVKGQGEPSSGEYTVIAQFEEFQTIISRAFAWLINPVIDLLRGEENEDGLRTGGLVREMYEGILSDEFRLGLQSLITLYIAFTLLGMSIGIVATSQKEFVLLAIKLGIVMTLLRDGSWAFFYKYLFAFFLDGANELINIFSSRYEIGTDFAFFDATLGMMLTSESIKRVLSLLMAGPIGWLCFALLVFAFWEFFVAAVTGMVLYLLAMVVVSILISMAPIFLMFLPFPKTRPYFDQWIKQLATYTMQPVAYFAVIGLLNQLVKTLLYLVMLFGVCKECLLPIYMGPPLPEICLVVFYIPMGYSDLSYEDRVFLEMQRGIAYEGNFFGLPFNIVYVLQFFFVAYCTAIIARVSLYMIQGIFSLMFASLGSATSGAIEGFKYGVGMDQESKERRRRAKKIDQGGEGGDQKKASRDKGASRGSGQSKDGKSASSDSDNVKSLPTGPDGNQEENKVSSLPRSESESSSTDQVSSIPESKGDAVREIPKEEQKEDPTGLSEDDKREN